MAASTHQDDELMSSINITPLVDVTLVLLVILMVTASYVVSKAIPLDLPKAATGEAAPPTLAVSIDARGHVYLDAVQVDTNTLRERVRTARRGNAELRAVIAADGKTSHARVVAVMDLLRAEDVSRFAIDVDPSALSSSAPNP